MRLSLECGAFLPPVHLLCIENRHQLTRRACGRNSDNPTAGGSVRHRKQSNATPVEYREVWGGMQVYVMGACCAGDVRQSLGAARVVLVP